MAKDPSFSFYTNDFDSKTKFFTHEQVGKYLRLLMAQHQHGHLTEKQMLFICGSHDEEVFSKFDKDPAGLYYNDRLDFELEKRRKFSESRSKNRSGSDTHEKDMNIISKRSENHMGQHMENENENENEKEVEIEKEKEKEKEVFDLKKSVEEKSKNVKQKSKPVESEPEPLENPFSQEFFEGPWARWKKFRIDKIKKPIDQGASENAALKLLWKDSKGDEYAAGEIIERSIAARWQGLFPLDRRSGSNGPGPGSNPGNMPPGQTLFEKPEHVQTITDLITKFNEMADMKLDQTDPNVRRPVSLRLMAGANPNDMLNIIELKAMEWGKDKRQYLTLNTLFGNKNYANFLQEVQDIKDKKRSPNISSQQIGKLRHERIKQALGQDF